MAALPVASACGPSTSTSSPSRIAGSTAMTPGARMSPCGTKLSIPTRYTPGICFHPPNVGRRRPVPGSSEKRVVFPAADHEIWEFPPHRHARGIDRHSELPRERPANRVLPDRSFSMSSLPRFLIESPAVGRVLQLSSRVIPALPAAIRAASRAPPSRWAITLRNGCFFRKSATIPAVNASSSRSHTR